MNLDLSHLLSERKFNFLVDMSDPGSVSLYGSRTTRELNNVAKTLTAAQEENYHQLSREKVEMNDNQEELI